MALTQIVKELILGWVGGEPSRQEEIVNALEAAQNLAPGAALTYNINVTIGGNDSTADGSLNKPFATHQAAEASVTDASVPGTLGGFMKNPDKNYVIITAPGNYPEDPSYSPNPYINHKGPGKDLANVYHNDSSSIVISYGDNYGFAQEFDGISFSQLNVIRNPGFTDTSINVALGGNGFVETVFVFNDFSSSGMFVQGSGWNKGVNPLLLPDLGGQFDIVADNVIFNDSNISGTFEACQFNQTGGTDGNLIFNSQGVDGNVPLNGGFDNTLISATARRIDLHDYVTLTARGSKVNRVRIFGRTNDPDFVAIYGVVPSYVGDAASQPLGGFAFPAGAQPDQGLPTLIGFNQTSVIGGTPFVNTTNIQNIISQGGAGVDITLQGGFEQYIYDYAGDCETNALTIRTPRFYLFSSFLGGTSALVSSAITQFKNGGSLTCVSTGIGSADGTAQVTDIQTVADVAGSLNNTFFEIYGVTSPFLEPILYVPWFNVNGAGTAPVVANANLVEVAIPTGANANAVATALIAAMQVNTNGRGPGEFMDAEPVSGNELTATNFVPGAVTTVVDGSAPTGFTFATPTPGVDPIYGTFTVSP